jgi:hypothetical protein
LSTDHRAPDVASRMSCVLKISPVGILMLCYWIGAWSWPSKTVVVRPVWHSTWIGVCLIQNRDFQTMLAQ